MHMKNKNFNTRTSKTKGHFFKLVFAVFHREKNIVENNDKTEIITDLLAYGFSIP